MARFLAYTSSERGHLYPIVPTLLELRARGHDVAIRTMPEEVAHLKSFGLRAGAVDPAIKQRPMDDWMAKTPIGAQRREVRAFSDRAVLEVPDFHDAVEMEKPDALLVDATSWGASSVAEASGLPWAYLVHFCLPIPSRDAPPYGLGLAPRHDALGRLRDGLIRRLVFAPLESIVLARMNQVRRSIGLPALRSAAEFFLAPPLVLCFTSEPFEYPRSDWPAKVRLVGPGIWDPPDAAPAQLEKMRRPLVLVTCSSEFQNDGKLAAVALEALADDAMSIVVTTGSVDPATLKPSNAFVGRYISHSAVLKHADCVICHGGMGITQKALFAGVPVVAVPFGRDQFEVARRVDISGAGVMLSASKLRADRLRDAVTRAMARKAGAQRIAAAFAQAGGAREAADQIEGLLASAASLQRAADL